MQDIGKKLWNMIEWLCDFFFRKLFRIPFRDEKWEAFMQFVKFGIVGVSNTLISYVTYVICISAGMHYLAAQVIGFGISVTNSFYWNNKFVFVSEEGKTRSLLKTYIKMVLSYAGTGLVLASALLILWVDVLHVPEVVAPLINLIITIPLNFIINKLWAFRSK